MPDLRCKDLRDGVTSSGLPFANISKSEFIEHIRTTTFLVDKSLMIAEFLGPDRDVPLVSTPSEEDVHATIEAPFRAMDITKKRKLLSAEHTAQILDSSDEVPGPQRRALIVRPRRFGKTFTLSMISDFLKMGDSKLSERGRKSIFQQTEMWRKFPNFCEMNFAQHPVIFASFKVGRLLVCVHIVKVPCSRTSRHRHIVSCVFH